LFREREIRIKSHFKIELSINAPRQAPALLSGHFYIRKSLLTEKPGIRRNSNKMLINVLPGFDRLGYDPKAIEPFSSPAMAPGIFFAQKEASVKP
jgi:hypothetical protein